MKLATTAALLLALSLAARADEFTLDGPTTGKGGLLLERAEGRWAAFVSFPAHSVAAGATTAPVTRSDRGLELRFATLVGSTSGGLSGLGGSWDARRGRLRVLVLGDAVRVALHDATGALLGEARGKRRKAPTAAADLACARALDRFLALERERAEKGASPARDAALATAGLELELARRARADEDARQLGALDPASLDATLARLRTRLLEATARAEAAPGSSSLAQDMNEAGLAFEQALAASGRADERAIATASERATLRPDGNEVVDPVDAALLDATVERLLVRARQLDELVRATPTNVHGSPPYAIRAEHDQTGRLLERALAAQRAADLSASLEMERETDPARLAASVRHFEARAARMAVLQEAHWFGWLRFHTANAAEQAEVMRARARKIAGA